MYKYYLNNKLRELLQWLRLRKFEYRIIILYYKIIFVNYLKDKVFKGGTKNGFKRKNKSYRGLSKERN